MEIAVKYHALKNGEHARIDYMAFLCKDGKVEYLFLEDNRITQQGDDLFLLRSKCYSYIPDQKLRKDESPVLLYWGTRYTDSNPDIGIISVEVEKRGWSGKKEWTVRIDGSVRIQYSFWCREVCFSKHDVLDEESCMRLAFARYLEHSYEHVPEASDDEIKERVARYWYKKATEEEEE